MSGSIAQSFLPSLFGSGEDGLLTALYGLSGPGQSTTNPIAALQQASSQQKKQVALTAAQPQMKRDIAAFTAAVAAAKTPADLLKNPLALKVLLTANGLGDHAGATALATRALLSDPAKPNALAARLADPRWLTMSKLYAFATKGLTALKTPGVLAGITNGYAEVLWRQGLNRTTPGLSNALDFQKRASTITSVDQVLSDPTFRDVVTTALGVPREIAFQSLLAQEKAISVRIDLKKFADPAFVTQFTRRYLIQKALTADAAAGAPDLSTLAVRSAGLVV